MTTHTYKFIILSKSDDSMIRQFKAIDMRPPLVRTDSIDYTVGGRVDKASGPIIKQFSYILRVPEDDPTDNYGTMDELRQMFELTNPNATPSDVIVLTTHYGEKYNCFFLGDMSPEPLTTMLEGSNAWHIVSVQLQVIQVHDEGYS